VVDDRRLQGVLFDSGDVLIRPIGGRWNPRYDLEGIVLAHHPDTQVERFPDLGCRWPSSSHSPWSARWASLALLWQAGRAAAFWWLLAGLLLMVAALVITLAVDPVALGAVPHRPDLLLDRRRGRHQRCGGGAPHGSPSKEGSEHGGAVAGERSA
jgi:hypothetical protein